MRGGFIEVLPDHVRILTDLAEKTSEIDSAQAQEAVKAAEEKLTDVQRATASTEGTEFPLLDIESALEGLQHAQSRVEAAQKR